MVTWECAGMTHSRLASNRWRLTERTAQESIVQRIINGSASPAEGTVCTKRDGGAVVALWHGGGGTAVPAYSRAVVVVVDEGGGAEGEAEGEGAAGRFRAELSFPSSVHDFAHAVGVRLAYVAAGVFAEYGSAPDDATEIATQKRRCITPLIRPARSSACFRLVYPSTEAQGVRFRRSCLDAPPRLHRRFDSLFTSLGPAVCTWGGGS